MLDRFRLAQTYRESYALTPDDLHDMAGQDAYGELLGRVLDGYRAVADGATGHTVADDAGDDVAPAAVADAAVTAATTGAPDVVVIEGSDFTGASLAVELVLNVDAANHLGAPVLLVVQRRHGGRPSRCSTSSGRASPRCASAGCTLIGVVANRVDPAVLDAVRAGLPAVVGDLRRRGGAGAADARRPDRRRGRPGPRGAVPAAVGRPRRRGGRRREPRGRPADRRARWGWSTSWSASATATW